MTVMLLLSLTTLASAQDGKTSVLPTGIADKTPLDAKKEEPPAAPPAAGNDTQPEEPKKDEEKKDDANPEHTPEGGEDQFLKSGKPRIKIDSIGIDKGHFATNAAATEVVIGPSLPTVTATASCVK